MDLESKATLDEVVDRLLAGLKTLLEALLDGYKVTIVFEKK